MGSARKVICIQRHSNCVYTCVYIFAVLHSVLPTPAPPSSPPSAPSYTYQLPKVGEEFFISIKRYVLILIALVNVVH